MSEVIRDLENKHEYLYKKKTVSRNGNEYWRYYPPKWEKGPIVSRVKLNPEQAVLTCCINTAPAVKLGLSGEMSCGQEYACPYYYFTDPQYT